MMRRFCFLVLVAVLACGGDSGVTNPASGSLAGAFALRTVNGSPLPFTIQSGTSKVVVTSDVLTVADGGTWTESGAFTQTVNGSSTNQVISAGGTFQRVGVNVSFNNATSGSLAYAGTFTGNGFNLSDASFNYTFTRQ